MWLGGVSVFRSFAARYPSEAVLCGNTCNICHKQRPSQYDWTRAPPSGAMYPTAKRAWCLSIKYMKAHMEMSTLWSVILWNPNLRFLRLLVCPLGMGGWEYQNTWNLECCPYILLTWRPMLICHMISNYKVKTKNLFLANSKWLPRANKSWYHAAES